MCVNPGILPDGIEFACRKCWQCLEQKIDDWVGRCLAESRTAIAAHSMSLTYGRDEHGNEDHFRSAWLTYSDVQKYFKLLRFDGYKFRYLVAGEYGSTKGRAHWHLIMFWQNKIPPHEMGRNFHNKYWPHGHQFAEAVNAHSIRYVCKYIQKDVAKDERQASLHMSKKPPLGDTYFRDLAGKYVAQGLAPQNLIYRFPEVKDKKGRPKDFYMTATTAHNFLESYKAQWAARVGGHHPNSTVIEKHDDKIARADYMPPRDVLAFVAPPSYEIVRNGQTIIVAGTQPAIGTDPVTGYPQTLYSDVNQHRWWYRKTGDVFLWQRGEKLEENPNPVMRMPGEENPYQKVRG